MHGSMGRVTGLVVALSMAALPALSSAETSEGSLLNNTFKVDLGTFVVSSDTQVEIDGETADSGTEIDFDNDIGYGDQTRLRLDAYWRFAEKHKIRLLYFNNSMDRDWTTDREISIGDSVFPVNATLSTDNKFTVTEIAYEYAFLHKPTWELAATGGIHWIKFSFDVSGEGSCTGVDCPPGGGVSFRSENHEANGPLPVLGLHGLWEFSPTWYLDGQVQFFTAKIDKFDGSVVDTRLSATKMFGPHFGVGAGWNRFVTRVDVDDGGDFSGSLHWGYSGFLVYVTGAF